MRLTEARQGVRMLKFMDVFGRWEAAELNQLDASELLGVGERTFRRWCRRYEEVGETGLRDRRIGKASGRRVPVDRCEGGRAFVSDAVSGLHRAAFPRALGSGASVCVELQLDEGVPTKPEFAAESGAARRAPSQATASSIARNDVAPGRLAARVAGGGTAARPGGDDGRRHERDLFGVPGRGRRHGFDVPGVVGSIRASRPAAEPVYRSRQSLLSHGRSRWQGGPRPADAGRARAGAFGDRAYRGVSRPGAWPVGAIVPDLTGSRAEGTGSGRDHDGGSGQRLAAR